MGGTYGLSQLESSLENFENLMSKASSLDELRGNKDAQELVDQVDEQFQTFFGTYEMIFAQQENKFVIDRASYEDLIASARHNMSSESLLSRLKDLDSIAAGELMKKYRPLAEKYTKGG